MPLLDHFRPPLQNERHWEGFHGTWAVTLLQRLNRSVLPAGYIAEPQISIGTQVEVDVATSHEGNGKPEDSGNGEGGVATAIYAPPKPSLSFSIDFANADTFEIQVQKEEGGLRLVAAIELVSPANKDRPANRAAFVRKCATYLDAGIGVIILDVVTSRSGNFHADLLSALAPAATIPMNAPNLLYAYAYRTVPVAEQSRLDVWSETLTIGMRLPTLPLWIDRELAVPVDLEQSYMETCESLRIRAR